MAIYYHINDSCESVEYDDNMKLVPFESVEIDGVFDFLDSEDDELYEINDHHECDEFFYISNINREDVILYTYPILVHKKERSDLEIWNDILSSVHNNTMLKEIEYLSEIIKIIDSKGMSDYKRIASKILSSVESYSCRLNYGVGISDSSLSQLIRYIPFFSSRKNIEFYLEKDTGHIGVIIPMKKNKKGTINITIMNTSEVYYSFVRKKTGLVKFSGKGFIGDDLNNSDAILAILNMSEW